MSVLADRGGPYAANGGGLSVPQSIRSVRTTRRHSTGTRPFRIAPADLPVTVIDERRRAGSSSTWASCGATASCCSSSPGATSRSATSRRSSGPPGRSSSRSPTMVVFSLFFGRRGVGADGRACPIRCSSSPACCPGRSSPTPIASAGQSVVGNQNLVTKVYFPRLIIPMGAVGAGLVDFAIAFGMLLVMMLCYGVAARLGLVLGPAADPARPGRRRPGRGHAAVGPDRRLPRLPLRRPVPGPALDVRHARASTCRPATRSARAGDDCCR